MISEAGFPDYSAIEKMRREAEAEAERQHMAEMIGTDDPEILQMLGIIGFDASTARLIFVMPLLQTAWTAGRVTRQQRKFIFEYARLHEIEEYGSAGSMLSHWIDDRPSDAFFELSLRVVSRILQSMPAERHESRKEVLLEYCARIAKASGRSFMRSAEVRSSVQAARLMEHFSLKLERRPI